MVDPSAGLPQRLELAEQIGGGRYAQVFRAYDKVLRREVAIKISSFQGRDSAERKRLKRELRVSSRLRHPRIVSAFDGLVLPDRVVLTLPYLAGGDLSKHCLSNENPRQRARRIQALAGAVDYLHQNGIVHGDIKPANIIADQSGNLHLTDFGSCCPVKQRPQEEAKVEAVGSPVYMAPEIVHGNVHPTIAADIYSLGATLFFLLTGKPPFSGDSISVLRSVGSGAFPTLASAGFQADSALQAIQAKACHQDPRKRYTSAADFAADLDRYISRRPIQAKKATLVSKLTLWSQRNRLAAWLTSFIAVVVLIGTATAATAWANSAARQRSVQRSRERLIEQGKQARLRESELQELLTQIESERDTSRTAAENQMRLRDKAGLARQTALEQSAVASAKLAEAKRLIADANKLQSQRASQEGSLDIAETIAARRAAFAEHLVTRREFVANHRFETGQDLDPLRKKSEIYQVPDEFRGIFSNVLEKPVIAVHDLSIDARFMVFDRTGEQALMLGARDNDAQLLRFDIAAASIHQTSVRVDDRTDGPPRGWTPVGACFSRDGQSYATCCVDNSGVYRLILPDANGRVAHEIDGRYHSMHFVDEDRCFVVRSRNDDVEIVVMPENRIVYSCRNARRSVIGDQASSGGDSPLLPFFIDSGTDSWEHILFATSRSPSGWELTPVFLHSVDFRSAIDRQTATVRTLDCGLQSLADWPHRWQLSEYAALGLGSKSLATTSPAPLSNSRFDCGTTGRTPTYSSIKCFPEQWKFVPTDNRRRIDSVYNESNLHVSVKPDKTEDRVANRTGEFGRLPSFDLVPGMLIFWTERGCLWWDLFNNDAFQFTTASFYLGDRSGRRDERVIASPQSNQQFYLGNKQLRWRAVSKWLSGCFQSVDDFHTRLDELEMRMGSDEQRLSILLAEGTLDHEKFRMEFRRQDTVPKDSSTPISNFTPLDIGSDKMEFFWRSKLFRLSNHGTLKKNYSDRHDFALNDSSKRWSVTDIEFSQSDVCWIGWSFRERSNSVMGIGTVSSNHTIRPVVPISLPETNPRNDVERLRSVGDGLLWRFHGGFAIAPGDDTTVYFVLGDFLPNAIVRYDVLEKRFSTLRQIDEARHLDIYQHDSGGLYVVHRDRIDRYELKDVAGTPPRTVFSFNGGGNVTLYNAKIISSNKILIMLNAPNTGSSSFLLNFDANSFHRISPSIRDGIAVKADGSLILSGRESYSTMTLTE